jgi:hypothetical protein
LVSRESKNFANREKKLFKKQKFVWTYSKTFAQRPPKKQWPLLTGSRCLEAIYVMKVSNETSKCWSL